MPHKPARALRPDKRAAQMERNARMLTERFEGRSLEELGEAYDLSPMRVEQVLMRAARRLSLGSGRGALKPRPAPVAVRPPRQQPLGLKQLMDLYL